MNIFTKKKLVKLFGEKCIHVIHAVKFLLNAVSHYNYDPEYDIINEIVNEGDVAVDVGANGADWTYQISKAVGRDGAVFAFEPDPYYSRVTYMAIKMLGLKNVRFFPLGLTSQAKTGKLVVSDGEGNRYSGESFIDLENKITRESYDITLRTLDSFAKKYSILKSLSLLKIDTEGFELYVIRGAMDTISKAKPIIITEVPDFDQCEYTVKDFVISIHDMEYKIYKAKYGKLVKVEICRLVEEYEEYHNIVLSPSEI